MYERIRLNLINPRVLKITVTNAVCTEWRCWTLPFSRVERERMQLVYEIILLNKILWNHLLSFRNSLQWNYALSNVKINRLTSISSNEIIKLPKYFYYRMSFPSLKQFLIYLMHDHWIILRNIFFGSWQLRAKILWDSSLPIIWQIFFQISENRPASR